MAKLAVIGGTGLSELPDAKIVGEFFEKTPFGMPSAPVREVQFNDTKILFLARHGDGHTILPSEINYRANIYALKSLGANKIISVAAVGSLKEEIIPGDFVVIDQFFDRTRGRKDTFFGEGVVAHVAFGEPVCPALRKLLAEAAMAVGARVHTSGTYVNIEGPAFSTRAEANFYKNILQADVVGMTNLTEAKLAREAGLCYSALAHVTDYDCWREAEEEVTVADIMKLIKKNIDNAKRILIELIRNDFTRGECDCRSTIKSALITPPESLSESAKKKLELILNL